MTRLRDTFGDCLQVWQNPLRVSSAPQNRDEVPTGDPLQLRPLASLQAASLTVWGGS